VVILDARAQADGQRVVAAGVVEGVAGDLEELGALLVVQLRQLRAGEDLPRALVGQPGGGALRGGGKQRCEEEKGRHRRGP